MTLLLISSFGVSGMQVEVFVSRILVDGHCILGSRIIGDRTALGLGGVMRDQKYMVGSGLHIAIYTVVTRTSFYQGPG